MTTEHARARWVDAHAARAAATGAGGRSGTGTGSGTGTAGGGTVGAVARDARGGVAAATSTGGRVDKRVGRVGDSPVLGAGTYADDEAGACSATGAGEAILRVGLTRGAADLLRAGVHPEDAARAAIRSMGARVGGTGGIVVVDRAGRLGFARNTRTMTWAAAAADVDLAAGA
jgi:beta-aspartyl-peptidase (threonine type)